MELGRIVLYGNRKESGLSILVMKTSDWLKTAHKLKGPYLENPRSRMHKKRRSAGGEEVADVLGRKCVVHVLVGVCGNFGRLSWNLGRRFGFS